MKPRARRIALLTVAIVCLLVGGCLGALIQQVTRDGRIGPARVSVVNVTGSDVVQLKLKAGVAYAESPLLLSGTRFTSQLSPDDSRELIVAFDIKGNSRQVKCGNIGVGEQRTITLLDAGRNAIVSFGEDNAVASLWETESVAPVTTERPNGASPR